MKKLILYGASDYGVEVSWISKSCGYEVEGFLDDMNITKQKGGIPILGNMDTVKEWYRLGAIKNFEFVVCIGNVSIREQKVKELKQFGVNFATIIHPSALIAPSATIGEGSIICPNCIISTFAKVGRHVQFNYGVTFAHNSGIGDFSTVNPQACISGNAIIGKNVMIGTNATIFQKITIGDHAQICAGATVNKNVSRFAITEMAKVA